MVRVVAEVVTSALLYLRVEPELPASRDQNNSHTQLAPQKEINDKYLTYVYSKIYTVSH